MDYEKKYKEALARMELCVRTGLKITPEYIFTELKESEDEKIRKELLEYIDKATGCKEWVAWLEKQGERKPAANIEPKFKAGDWIVDNRTGIVHYIANIKGTVDGCYYVVNGCYCVLGYDKGLLHIDNENDYHLWTIQDAKDGDVLVYEGEIFMIKSYVLWNKIVYHCCYDGKNLYKDSVYYSWGRENFDKVHPATKEQRDQLEKAITDAGYEFDFEKKELKKVEQNPADKCVGCNNVKGCVTCVDGSEWAHVSELNPAWSEEDITNYSKVLFCLQTLTFPTDNERKELITWLKKQCEPQPHWKPTEEQLMALRDAIDNNEMESLYNDLKKL